MTKPDDESNLEIVSIGTLYAGQWDKKYWSSSRGKDRYPYPVGYQALRTHNGLTYKMEVHEGTKGPIFQITSNDKQSGSGDTPDRAWKNFQKECCSRVKLWPGKRFSGKVDGVEFFGFKNALVQRLLRELVATINDASDQSSHLTNSSKASTKGRAVGQPLKHKHPELTSFLEKPKVTGKRSRTRSGIDTKSACKKSHKICQPLNEADQPMISSTSNLCDINQADEPSPLVSGHDLPIKSVEVLDDSKSICSLPNGQNELGRVEKFSSPSLADAELPREEILLDRECTRVLEHGVSVMTEEENGNAEIIPEVLDSRPQVLVDSQVNHFADVCIPDTLDTQQDSSGGRKDNAPSRTELVADLVFSEEPISKSHSEDKGCNLIGSSEKSDSDTFSCNDISMSMLSILIPRAIPYLTYSSKKKKRKATDSEEISTGIKSDDKLSRITPSIDATFPDKDNGLVSLAASTHAKSDVQEVKREDPSTSQADLENAKYIVPDSLDDGPSEYLTANMPPPFSSIAENVSVGFLENREPWEKKSSDSFKATEVFHDNKNSGCNEILAHEEPSKDCDIRAEKDSIIASHFSVGGQFVIPTNHFVPGDSCSTAGADSNGIEPGSRNAERETIPDGKDKDYSAELKSLSVPTNTLPGNTIPKNEEYCAPLSEIIICRNNGDNCVPEMDHGAENLVSSNHCQSYGISKSGRSKITFGVQGKLERQNSYIEDENAQDGLDQNISLPILQEQEHCSNSVLTKDVTELINGTDIPKSNSQTDLQKDKNRFQHCESASHIVEDVAECRVSWSGNQNTDEEVGGKMKLIGNYLHPMRISCVKLAEIGDEIYVCVSCGPVEDGKRELFLYKLSNKEPRSGEPCMIGHTSMRWPLLKDEFGREVVIDKCGIEFTPDARALALIDSIRMPNCREKNLHCSCPQCESCCFEENAVKIVRIQQGYVSLILKLNTIYAVHCILICGPDCLIAVDESGRIYLWTMDPTWSIKKEAHIILSYDFLPSRIIELKRVPKSSSMVIGHNGYGHFSLWDMVKRTVVSEFSAPASSVLEYHPVSLFRWQNKCLSRDKLVIEECVKKLVEETTLSFSKYTELNQSCPMDWKDVAVCVLMYTSSNSNVQSGGFSSNCNSNSDGCWRLCLMVNRTVVIGPALPSSTTAIGSSSGIGIIGTQQGDINIWELGTGKQLKSLHNHTGKAVSHVAVGDSSFSIVAIAHDGGQLSVYLRT